MTLVWKRATGFTRKGCLTVLAVPHTPVYYYYYYYNYYYYKPWFESKP